MGKKLAKAVSLMDNAGTFQTYAKGSEPPADVAEQITNPAAWAPESAEERSDGGAWPPDGGFEAMDDEEVFAAANSTSLASSDDLNTQKESGDFDPSGMYQNKTVPQLRALAEERDLDTSGMTRKQEIIDLLAEDDASNS